MTVDRGAVLTVDEYELRCYWWPLEPPPAGEKPEMGLNMNNVDPELLKYVDKKYDYAQMKQPVGSRELAHPDDQAQY